MPEQPGTQPVEVKTEKGIVHKFDEVKKKASWKEVLLPAGLILAIIISGAVTGYLLANWGTTGSVIPKKAGGKASIFGGPKEAGTKDAELFPDKAQGRIEINDSEVITEGSHRLVRPGGEAQTAYLTSSVVDLNQFLGKCAEVWGQTFTAQKAGWLMDIGWVEILDRCPEGV